MPVERNFIQPEDEHRLPEISYTAEGDLLVTPRVVHDDDQDGLMQTVLEVLAILRRVGGTIQIGSQRAEIAPNVVITESYIFAYNSFTPLVRRLERPEAHDEQDAGADLTDAELEDAAGLTAEELAQHFPGMEESALGDAIARAQAEQPAEPEPAAAVE